MITKKVKIIEHSMMGDTTLKEYKRDFTSEKELRGFLITEEESQNLNRVLKVSVVIEDVG